MELKATTRELLGKKVKALRAVGTMPAELFGHGIKISFPFHKGFCKIVQSCGRARACEYYP